MPRGDGTGPAGQGPGTGRGLGRGGAGSGRGGGMGRGAGQGRMGGQAAGIGGYCVCPSCGEKVPHQQGVPCNQIECPKCGTTMTRE
jgi:hypothetical protein